MHNHSGCDCIALGIGFLSCKPPKVRTPLPPPPPDPPPRSLLHLFGDKLTLYKCSKPLFFFLRREMSLEYLGFPNHRPSGLFETNGTSRERAQRFGCMLFTRRRQRKGDDDQVCAGVAAEEQKQSFTRSALTDKVRNHAGGCSLRRITVERIIPQCTGLAPRVPVPQ